MSSSIPVPMNRIHQLEYLVSQLTSKIATIQSSGTGSGSFQPSDIHYVSRLCVNTVDDSNTVNIVNTDRTSKAVSIRNANEYNTICTIDNDGDMVLHGSITASNAYITVADVPLTDVGATLESLDGSVTSLEEQITALAQALTNAGILASAAFGSSLAYTLASSVILGSNLWCLRIRMLPFYLSQ